MDSFCRGCLRHVPPDSSPPLSNPDVKGLFIQCSAVEVETNDGLPQSICMGCYSKCIQLSTFRSMCQKTEESLRSFPFYRDPRVTRPLKQENPPPVVAEIPGDYDDLPYDKEMPEEDHPQEMEADISAQNYSLDPDHDLNRLKIETEGLDQTQVASVNDDEELSERLIIHPDDPHIQQQYTANNSDQEEKRYQTRSKAVQKEKQNEAPKARSRFEKATETPSQKSLKEELVKIKEEPAEEREQATQVNLPVGWCPDFGGFGLVTGASPENGNRPLAKHWRKLPDKICPECGSDFKSSWTLKQHLMIHKKRAEKIKAGIRRRERFKREKKYTIYACIECRRDFTGKREYDAHMASHMRAK